MTAARKAAVTRKARKQFKKHYGEDTYNVVKAIIQGKNSHEIADNFWLSIETVAAYRANVTRGTYWHMTDLCNF